MLTQIPSNEDILRAMERYCERRGLTLTELSKRCGNISIATRLKSGKCISIQTYNRIADAIKH